MNTNTYKIFRAKDGRGVSNLLLVIQEGIPDVLIGMALLVPIADGYKDPIGVTVLVDDKGMPVRTNVNTCVVTEYHF